MSWLQYRGPIEGLFFEQVCHFVHGFQSIGEEKVCQQGQDLSGQL